MQERGWPHCISSYIFLQALNFCQDNMYTQAKLVSNEKARQSTRVFRNEQDTYVVIESAIPPKKRGRLKVRSSVLRLSVTNDRTPWWAYINGR